MTGRHWFRKDVLLPIFYVLAFGAGLYWLNLQLEKVPATAGSDFVHLALRVLLAVYLLLVAITARHILSTYDLERYDPGDPASIKRLMRRRRFKLRRMTIPDQTLLVAMEQVLLDVHYHLETESHLIGRVYRRSYLSGLFGRLSYDRVIIIQHEPLNVLLVDQLLQDCIRYIRSQAEKPSRRNMLVMVTRMTDADEAASAAAGVVNFLGKFKGGTLCPLMLATRQQRLYYPADRTLLPRSHRLFQDCLRFRLKKSIRHVQDMAAQPEPVQTEAVSRPDPDEGQGEH